MQRRIAPASLVGNLVRKEGDLLWSEHRLHAEVVELDLKRIRECFAYTHRRKRVSSKLWL